MKPSTQLFDLIQTLSQAEKRYFKLFAKQNGANQNYLLLFDKINLQKEYNESALRKHFEGQPWIKHFASEKHYLYQLILKSMRAFHARKKVDTQLRDWLDDLKFLKEKQQFRSCEKLLKKAKSLANKFDRFTELLKLIEYERQLLKFTRSKKIKTELAELDIERGAILNKMEDQYTLVNLYDLLFSDLSVKFRLSTAEAKLDLDKFLEHPLLSQPIQGQSFHARSYFYLCHAYACRLKGQLEEANRFFEKNILLWKEHNHWQKDDPFNYRKALANFLSSCHSIGRIEPFPETLEQIKSLPCATLEEKTARFSDYHFYQLNFHLLKGEFEKAALIGPEIAQGLKVYAKGIPLGRKSAFYYNLMVVSLITERFSEGITWLNPVVNNEQNDFRRDLQRLARIFLLLLHFELNNLELGEPLIRKANRFLSSNGGINSFEEICLQHFKKLYRARDKGQELIVFRSFFNELDSYSKNPSHGLLGLSEFLFWLQAKLKGKKMLEIAKEKLNSQQ